MMPLCLGWTLGHSLISELIFLPHRGKDFFSLRLAVNYFLTDLSTTHKLTCWSLAVSAHDSRANESQLPVQSGTYGRY